MSGFDAAGGALALRLWLARRGTISLLGAALCAAGAVAWLWQRPHARLEHARSAQAGAVDRAAPVPVAPPRLPDSGRNLVDFYAALGQRRYAEQQVKTLFAIAAKTGLTLSSGQYTPGFERSGRFYTYQIVLPVTGSYRDVWRFCLKTLDAIPFASLDEISFRREKIADATLQARLRLTVYLSDAEAQP